MMRLTTVALLALLTACSSEPVAAPAPAEAPVVPAPPVEPAAPDWGTRSVRLHVQSVKPLELDVAILVDGVQVVRAPVLLAPVETPHFIPTLSALEAAKTRQVEIAADDAVPEAALDLLREKLGQRGIASTLLPRTGPPQALKPRYEPTKEPALEQRTSSAPLALPGLERHRRTRAAKPQ